MRRKRVSRDSTGCNDIVQIYRDAKKEWRWRRVASNGKIVGASSESFKTLAACRTNFYRQGKWIDSDKEVITIDGVAI